MLAGLLALPAPARAADLRPVEAPVEVPVPERPDAQPGAKDRPLSAVPVPDQPVSSDMSPSTGPEAQVPEARVEGPAPPPPPSLAPGAGLGEPEDAITVAVGLGPTAPGTKPEVALVDALERAVRSSAAPRTTVRRLRAGVGEGKLVCRERRDDLVILVEYLADRPDPVLLPHDCRLDRALGVRGADAANHPELVATLWGEHEALVRDGAKERRRTRLGPKVRTGLIAGGAILAVGLAIGLVVAASLRREIVVLTVSP
ncbi:hypothetical protein [Nannocystis bainbridge]|uniref:Uncharacterized protein n=1 Tax=Nannocystis bainbridge TaxID=2995303 RepID=A0ABT5DSD4_9BACT|nr:hypothetical protein [Nannocystis bainbridge]MDC0715974.1 hypothetical protein [Nannocystis bainbridge]